MSAALGFTPFYGATVAVATLAGAATANVPPAARALRILNVGTQLAFVRVRPAGSVADATAADLPVAAGTEIVILKNAQPSAAQGETVVSVFAAAAGSTVYITPGEYVRP